MNRWLNIKLLSKVVNIVTKGKKFNKLWYIKKYTFDFKNNLLFGLFYYMNIRTRKVGAWVV